ncbi:MAG: right-handed parallel beta-helix repeat-containing protein [Candidatus Thermoplasmatota archaeon]|nr:right-handed parallel beta-helix repeat-containing protein [Candidatus Thermoplasmatota archaeon]
MKRVACILIFLAMAMNMFNLTGNGEEQGTRATVLPPYVHNDFNFDEDEYLLIQDMYIDAGVQVNFTSCTVKVSKNTEPIRIWVDGNVKLGNVHFISGATDPRPGDWQGFVVRGRSNFAMGYSSIEHAVVGVDLFHSEDSTMIRFSSFTNMSIAGIRFNNFEYTNGTIYAPHDVYIYNTIFKDCGWGIIENGFNTEIEKCEFINNDPGGILVGNGTYPFSKGLYLDRNTFTDNRNASIQIGSEGDRSCGITDLHTYHNEFRSTGFAKNYVVSRIPSTNLTFQYDYFYEGYQGNIMEMEDCEDLLLRNNHFYGIEENGKFALLLSGFRNFNATSNYLFGMGGDMLVQDGDIAKFRVNQLRSECAITCNNVTDAAIHKNYGGFISVKKSAPVAIYDNRGSDIRVSGSINAREIGDILVFNNSVGQSEDTSMYFADNIRTYICNNSILRSGGSGMAFRSQYTSGIQYILENNTIMNSTDYDIEMDQFMEAEYGIIIKNTTFDPEKVKLEWNTTIQACWFMKVRTLNDIKGPLDAFMNVMNSTGIHDSDHEVSGEWGLVQGPYMEFVYNTTDTWEERSDPKYEDVMCDLTFTADNRLWETTVNWSRYLEMDLTLDAFPVFNDPEIIHFDEDQLLDLNISDLFSDLDAIDVEITGSDGNLTFENDTVRSTFENWTGTSNVTFRATDTFGNHTDGTVTFIVDPINDAPAISPEPDDIFMDEDTVHVIELGLHMYDAEDDLLEWTFEETEHLAISLDNVTWNLTIAPDENWYGNTSLTLHLGDGQTLSNITVEVNVRSVNDAPVFNAPENWNITVYRGTLQTIDLLSMVFDVEDDEISFSMDPSSEYVTITNGELAILFPESTDATLLTLEITADDGNGGTDTVSLRIIIDHGTSPPPEGWDLYSSNVEVDEKGNWYVGAAGSPGIDVYLVVKDEEGKTATYKMEEDSEHPGNYSLEIDSSKFEEGMVYSYFFTNATGNGDLEPDLSGIEVQPGEEVEEVPSLWALIIGGICITLLVVLVIILLIVVIARRSGKGHEEE